MRDAVVVSVPLPVTGDLVDILLSHGQTYVRDVEKYLVPRVISFSGWRWHNTANRSEVMQILRALTIAKGGVYVHWDALAARSAHLKTNNLKALGSKIAASHAHASRNHQAFVSRAVDKLFRITR